MADERVRDLGELALLDRVLPRLHTRRKTTLRGPGGDAAILAQEGGQLALSTDAAVEGVHFDLSFMSLADAGWRATVGALGDLAAVGAEPRAVLLSCGLRDDLAVSQVDELFQNLDSLGEREGFDLVGGDVVASPRTIFLDIAVVGHRPLGVNVDRAGSRPGDLLVVTGELGGAMAGLASLRRRGSRPHSTSPCELQYLRPKSRIREGRDLARSKVHAMTDVSDGLAAELVSFARVEPGLIFVVDRNQIPISEGVEAEATRTRASAVELALAGGEDSELLLTVSPGDYAALKQEFEVLHPATSLTVIGEILPASHQAPAPHRAWTRTSEGALSGLPVFGFEHFGR